MRKLIIILLLLLLTSCDKKYSYVELVEKKSFFGDIERKEKDSETIYAKNDSAAYIEEYKKFCISLRVTEEMKKSTEYNIQPLDFKLINSEGIDISELVFFENKEAVKDSILTLMMNIN